MIIKSYSYTEFAEMCGKPYNTITANITRKKIIVDENKKINILNETNKAFLDRCHNSIQKISPVKTQSGTKYSENQGRGRTAKKSEQDQDDLNFDITKLNEYEVPKLQRIKIISDIKKIENETNLRKLEYAKKKKKVLPLLLAITNMNTFLIGTVGKVKNEMDKFIENEFEDNEEALKHKKHVHLIIEQTIRDNLENAIIEMEKEADEYSLITSW